MKAQLLKYLSAIETTLAAFVTKRPKETLGLVAALLLIAVVHHHFSHHSGSKRSASRSMASIRRVVVIPDPALLPGDHCTKVSETPQKSPLAMPRLKIVSTKYQCGKSKKAYFSTINTQSYDGQILAAYRVKGY